MEVSLGREFIIVQCLSHIRLFVTPWTAACQASLLGKEMATHSSTITWKSPWTEEPGRLLSMGLLRVRHDWVTSLSLFIFMHWRRNSNPLQYSCLENPRDRGAWWAAIYEVAQSQTRLKWLSRSSSRLPCPSLSHRVCSNSCPLSWWCHPTVSSSVIPFSCLQSFPASRSFPKLALHIGWPKVLDLHLQPQSFQWIFRVYFL